MNPLTDQEFQRWLDATERNEDISSSLPEDDAADLRLAKQLFVLREPYARPYPYGNARSLTRSPMARPTRRKLVYAMLGTLAFTLAVLLTSAFGATIIRSLDLGDTEYFSPPQIVIFEGRRYDLEEFRRIEPELLQAGMFIVLDEDENGDDVYYVFRTDEDLEAFFDAKPRRPSIERK